jgi:Tol biopolymer transport system component
VQGTGFGQYTNLTNAPVSWDEHAVFSPDGQKIAYISSLPFPNIIPEYGALPWSQFRDYLHNEMFLMNSDGTQVQQLTFFNTPGSAEYTPQFADAMYPTWNLAGTQLLVQNGTADDPVAGGNSTWLLTFQSACGGQASQ